ncbi:MAG: DNA-formamidopyrimidine glycosylase family protein, partial [Myxococcota bacterium]
MPELPDIQVYVEALTDRFVGQTVERVRLKSPFLVRSYAVPVRAIEGKTLRRIHSIGKRLAFGFDDDLWMVIHLMVAGRFKLKKQGAAVPGRLGLCAFDFSDATLLLTEASKKKRASLHMAQGADQLKQFDRGGIDVFAASRDAFADALTRENHTLKRTMTDPRVFSGIGNA